MCTRTSLTFLIIISAITFVRCSSEDSVSHDVPHAPLFCIATADNRFGTLEHQVAATKTMRELNALWNKSVDGSGSDLTSSPVGVHTLAAFLNKRYALQHGLPFFLSNHSNASFYPGVAARPYIRHPAWEKIGYLRTLLASQPQCTWFLWLDSDAYLWMQSQRVSLLTFAQRVSVHEFTHGFGDIDARRTTNGALSFDSRSFAIGLNGYENGTPGERRGFPRPPGTPHHVCSGIFFVSNTPAGAALLADWDGPEGNNTSFSSMSTNQSKAEHDLWYTWANKFPWEQAVLGLHVLPKHRTQIIIYSFLELNDAEGPFIRHLWSALRRRPDCPHLKAMWLTTRQLFQSDTV